MNRFCGTAVKTSGLGGLLALLSVLTAQQPTDIDLALGRLSSPSPEVRRQAFYELFKPFGGSDDAATGAARLVRAHPGQAETVKLALFAELERESAYAKSMEDTGQQMTEGFGDFCYDLRRVVGSFRDGRALNGLLAMQSTSIGIEPEFIGDLCPGAVDAIIARAAEAPKISGGIDLHSQAGPIWDLGACLRRVDMDASSSEKARAALIRALGHTDSSVRQAAIDGLFPLRNDPDVRAKLEAIATLDPYFGPARPNEANGRYWIREQASRFLKPPGGDKSYYVMRTNESHECRIQEAAEAAVGDRYIGPFQKADDAKRSLCVHIDPVGANSSLCWRTAPVDVCRK